MPEDPHTPTPPSSPQADAAAAAGEGLDEARRVLLRVAGVGGFVLLTSWFAVLGEIRLPPYGIPMSLQSLAVVLSALALGPRFGTLAMLVYYAVGLLGYGVFYEGHGGLVYAMGNTGGYLLGFILCQPVIARGVRRPDGRLRGWLGFTLGVLGGHLVIFLVGVPWLYVAVRFGAGDETMTAWVAVREGFITFAPLMLLKVGLAVMLGRLAAPWAMKRVW
ncbi:MAG: biotin transport system substrate-specific component [Phycisphaerales bacterium]|jgi:biotin transport system substrate-specific component